MEVRVASLGYQHNRHVQSSTYSYALYLVRPRQPYGFPDSFLQPVARQVADRMATRHLVNLMFILGCFEMLLEVASRHDLLMLQTAEGYVPLYFVLLLDHFKHSINFASLERIMQQSL
ncbi:hypothetical protein DL546_006608 [Coniochaeta pulveracea]|uniref:Uncharacterized protein n=1 Tax=Coniochaeta pulveracea TaxID=177199 RepID=A0A420Y8X5_9PEZI|nr:hypothetical protein DL546_006608 [Coniochaeta pulveracea]